MAEENKQDWRVYVIPDMRTWAFPSEYEKQSKIEYFNSFDEAKKRFDELRKEPYNSEHALGYDGKPSARLAMGVQRGTAAFDILHVRAGENVLVDDFTRSPFSMDNSLLSVMHKAATEIGFDKVNSIPTLENGKYGEPVLVPFNKWAAEHTQYNFTGGKSMEHNTTFDVSSISKIDNGGSTKAIANVVINNEFSVRGVRVVEGEKGAFVAMPSKKIGSDYTDVAFPVTKEAREAINNAVLKSYKQLMASPEKTIKNNLPTAEQSKSSVSVQLKPVENNAHIKAAGQVTIDGCIVVRDVKVLATEGKPPFVSMPSYQTQAGDYSQYAMPITKDMHEKLDKAVLGSFHSLGKVEYKGVKYAELGDKSEIAALPKQNNVFAQKIMAELDKAGIKYQARIEDKTTIFVNKADLSKATAIKDSLVPPKQVNENKPPKHSMH